MRKEDSANAKVAKAVYRDGVVFWVMAELSAALIVWSVFFTDNLTAVLTVTFEFIIANLSWFYMIVTSLFLGFCIYAREVSLREEGEQQREPVSSSVSKPGE